MARYLPKRLARRALVATVVGENVHGDGLDGLMAELFQHMSYLELTIARKAFLRMEGQDATASDRAAFSAIIAGSHGGAPVVTKALEALEAVQNDGQLHHEERVEVIDRMAAVIPQDLAPCAMAVAQEIGDEARLLQTIACYLPHLSEPQRGELLKVTLNRVQSVRRRSEEDAVMVLAALARVLTESLADDALRIVGTIESEGWRVEALAALVPSLSQRSLPSVRKMIRGMTTDERLAKVLAALALAWRQPRQGAVLSDAVFCARHVGERGERAHALTRILPCTPVGVRHQACQGPGIVRDCLDSQVRIV
jgi:hypothetical protein